MPWTVDKNPLYLDFLFSFFTTLPPLALGTTNQTQSTDLFYTQQPPTSIFKPPTPAFVTPISTFAPPTSAFIPPTSFTHPPSELIITMKLSLLFAALFAALSDAAPTAELSESAAGKCRPSRLRPSTTADPFTSKMAHLRSTCGSG
jgi:hypothetical protein